MPEEKRNITPQIDQQAWDKAREGVPRELQAARLIVSNNGRASIPMQGYLRGQSDHSPVLQNVADFAGTVYSLLDAVEGSLIDLPDYPEVKTALEAVTSAMEKLEA